MLALAQKKELYKNVYISLLGGQHQAPIPDGKSSNKDIKFNFIRSSII